MGFDPKRGFKGATDAEEGDSWALPTGQTEGTEIDLPHVCEDDLDLPGTSSPPTIELVELLDEVVDMAVKQFLSEFQRPPTKRSLSSWSTPQRKRARTNLSLSYVDVEDLSDTEDSDAVILKLSTPDARPLPCPFYLKDRKKNMNCLTHHQLLSIEDVKDHLCVVHRQPFFCPICTQKFPTGRARDDHIRSRSCTRKTSPAFEGITDWQAEQLSDEETTSSSWENRWFEIWDIAFPQTPRPASPSFSTAPELAVCHFRNFWGRHGQTIISGFLESKDIRVDAIENVEKALGAFYHLVLQSSVEKVFKESACSAAGDGQ
ncbi:hypothetical protein VPNG_05241 [Cytospora leucostoma]|uniref:C2H2-type domain-containing protein n=1 Tax=Cytospora leucostoma TaxID=1230097 RepID=A0A423X7Q1_9PEZI|nr:hypothetical protein VPNG_05241 [Cytospora leucostoma]